jgi:tetratricopeptide (TPR) repeat protein
MKVASLLVFLLLTTPLITHPTIAQAGQPMQRGSSPSTDPNDRVQTLINQKQYDRAWQEIRQIAKNMDRRAPFDWSPRNGSGFISRWGLTLAQSELNTKDYQKAVKLAMDFNDSAVRLAVMQGLYQSGQRPLYDQLIKKIAPTSGPGFFAAVSAVFFQSGNLEESDRMLMEGMRQISLDDAKIYQQSEMLQSAGIQTHNLDRAIQVADRLGIAKSSSAQIFIAEMALQQGNGAVADRYLKEIQSPTERSRLRYNQATLYFTQQQPTLGLASLRQALLASLDLVDDLDQRDTWIEQIALLYQQQKQPKLARDTAQKVFKSDRRQALLNKLK